MLRSTELNTFGMTTTIYRDLLCRATEGYLSIEGVNSVAVRWLNIYMGNDWNPFVANSLKMLNPRIVITMKTRS